jgi:hypothetical protein
MKTKILQSIKNGIWFVISKIPKKYRVTAVVLFTLFAVYWLAIAGINAAWAFSGNDVTFQMEGRERVERDGGSQYEIYTSEGVFANKDSMLHFKTRSGDLQNDLRFGRWYQCETQGFRFPWMNLMENVIECEEIAEPKQPSTGNVK